MSLSLILPLASPYLSRSPSRRSLGPSPSNPTQIRTFLLLLAHSLSLIRSNRGGGGQKRNGRWCTDGPPTKIRPAATGSIFCNTCLRLGFSFKPEILYGWEIVVLFCMCFSTPICIVLIYERSGFNGMIFIATLVGWLVGSPISIDFNP